MLVRSPRSNGFTLVELLVTVSIIAVLIGVLLPSLNSSRRQAKLVACGANLRSIGQLIHAYAFENQGRIPRGPSGNMAADIFPGSELFSRDVATSALWIGIPFPDNSLPVPLLREPQYTGLGLLLRQPGKRGNEVFYCPADDQQNLNEEALKIGQDGAFAFSSYLYRQMDMTPPEIQREGELDNLGTNRFPVSLVGKIGSSQFEPREMKVQALALDSQSEGCENTLHTNHDGKKVNVVYKDGSVQAFDNDLQSSLQQGIGYATVEVHWASIPSLAFPGQNCNPAVHLVKENLDRIFVAADYGYLRPEPWTAPDPRYPYP